MKEQSPSENTEFERLKTSLVSLLSHELRTPLTYISASIEMMEIAIEEPSMKEEMHNFLNIMARGVKQLNTIIDDLLLFSTLEKTPTNKQASQVHEGINIKDLVHDVVAALKPSLQAKKQNLSLVCNEELPELTIDSGKVSEILVQLLSNAIKFTPGEGQVSIQIILQEQHIQVDIIDSGPGIPQEIQEQIFQPFFQQENHLIREHGGLGLGLALAQRLCGSIGARLSVSSQLEQGATFTLLLPLVNTLFKQNQEMSHLLDEVRSLSQSHEKKDEHIHQLKQQLWQNAENLKSAYQSAEEKQQELDNVYIDMMKGFAAALEARDPYTKGRSQRLASYAELVATACNMKDEEKEWLRKGCLLCDIGYIGISDDILNKSGFEPLTEEEFQHIKLHPRLGMQMLKDIKAFEPLLPIIQYHHENWDGSGYPEGLKADDIPYMARIVRLVDAFDAMLSDRAYRSRFSPEYALKELHKFSGTQFDPELVNIFDQLWEDGRLKQLLP